MEKKWNSIFFLLILILGAVLRICNLGTESVWYDEVSSLDQAFRNLPSLFCGFHLSPLYFLILRYWVRVVGVSEFALRIPSVIFGVGAIFLIYKLSVVLFNRKVGLCSSFILAISPFHIFYSQDARHYALFVFLTLLSILLYLKIVRNPGPGINLYIFYGIVTALLLYTTIWGIFVIVIQNLFYWQNHFHKKRWFITQIVIFVIFLFWLVPFFMFMRENGEYVKACLDWIERPDVNSLIETFRTFSFGGSRCGGWVLFFKPEEIWPSQSLLYLLGFFFILGVLSSGNTNNGKILFVSIWLFMPIVTLFLFSLLFYPLFVIRYLIFVSPAYYILVAKGIEKAKKPLLQIVILSFIAILSLPVLTTYYVKELKTNWKEAIRYLENRIGNDEVIIVVPSHASQMFSYYSRDGVKLQDKDNRRIAFIKDLGVSMLKGGFVYKQSKNILLGVNNPAQFKKLISTDSLVAKNRGMWLIFFVIWFSDYHEFIKYFDDRYQRDNEYYFNGEGISVYHYFNK